MDIPELTDYVIWTEGGFMYWGIGDDKRWWIVKNDAHATCFTFKDAEHHSKELAKHNKDQFYEVRPRTKSEVMLIKI